MEKLKSSAFIFVVLLLTLALASCGTSKESPDEKAPEKKVEKKEAPAQKKPETMELTEEIVNNYIAATQAMFDKAEEMEIKFSPKRMKRYERTMEPLAEKNGFKNIDEYNKTTDAMVIAVDTVKSFMKKQKEMEELKTVMETQLKSDKLSDEEREKTEKSLKDLNEQLSEGFQDTDYLSAKSYKAVQSRLDTLRKLLNL